MVAARGGWGAFAHLWLGCTAENQRYWDRRLPVLLGIAGVAKRFVSVEPMLGPIDPRGLKPDWTKEDDVLNAGDEINAIVAPEALSSSRSTRFASAAQDVPVRLTA